MSAMNAEDDDRPPTAAEGACSCREDGTHCEHWWDSDGPCCDCGFSEELTQ